MYTWDTIILQLDYLSWHANFFGLMSSYLVYFSEHNYNCILTQSQSTIPNFSFIKAKFYFWLIFKVHFHDFSLYFIENDWW